jgi:CDP-diacylglycerol--glycerol-3-phosphate 3-phosphatidyltransferase
MAAIYGKFWIVACILFVIASFTDFFDGYYARLYHEETEMGRILDPLADKILIFSTLWALYRLSDKSFLPTWFIFFVVGKDIILMLGACFLVVLKKDKILSPSLFSKFITVLFMVFFVNLILVHYGSMPNDYIPFAIKFFTIATILILLDYSYKFYIQIMPGVDS